MRIVKRRAGIRTLSYNFLALLLTLVCAGAGLQSCTQAPSDSGSLTVFAAASLGEAMQDLSASFEKLHPALSVTLNLAGSNVLARQIADGARADLFISANNAWVDRLAQQSLLIEGSRTGLLSNQLVIVHHASSSWTLATIEQLPDLPFRFLAVGNPQGVPAGIYAQRYLASIAYQQSNLWSQLSSRIAPAADVRRALSMVAADPSVIGMVYATDIRNHASVKPLFRVPANAVSINYEAALIDSGRADDKAQLLLEFLTSPVAASIYRKHGFSTRIP